MIQQNRERGKKQPDKSTADPALVPVAAGEEEEEGDGEGALPKVMALERSSSLLPDTEVSAVWLGNLKISKDKTFIIWWKI